MSEQTDRWPLALFLVFWAATCIDPPYPRELVLQHIPTALAVVALLGLRRQAALSRTGGRLVLVFLILHVLGARYLYSYVPYDDWSTAVFGRGLSTLCGFTRNHYDRLVHFAYGVLLLFPAREVFGRRFGRSGLVADLLAVQFILATSALYELVEWCVALMLAPDWAEHYNGQQGDLWDAQKDMALAALGGLVALLGRVSSASAISRPPRKGRPTRPSAPAVSSDPTQSGGFSPKPPQRHIRRQADGKRER
jgi:putative membrane protein